MEARQVFGTELIISHGQYVARYNAGKTKKLLHHAMEQSNDG
jgi:hypothetical protein